MMLKNQTYLVELTKSRTTYFLCTTYLLNQHVSSLWPHFCSDNPPSNLLSATLGQYNYLFFLLLRYKHRNQDSMVYAAYKEEFTMFAQDKAIILFGV